MENSRKAVRKNNTSACLTKNKTECKTYNDFIALYPHLYADHLSILSNFPVKLDGRVNNFYNVAIQK